jgi:hypothetical protein
MRTLIVTLAIAVGSLRALKAGAQVVIAEEPWEATPVAVRATYPTSSIVPYSYYAAIPFPARGYVGAGDDEFPYFGRPYGSPSDPWTWPYLSESYDYGVLARYYYPPVR